MAELDENVKIAYRRCQIVVVEADGCGYTLYCIDVRGKDRFFIEVYEETGEVVVYGVKEEYNYEDVDEMVWIRLNIAHSAKYREIQTKKWGTPMYVGGLS